MASTVIHVPKPTVNNLTTTSVGSALDASQGKVLNDKISKINTAQRTINQNSSGSAGSKFTRTAFRAYAIGNLVIMHGILTATDAYGSSDVMLTIDPSLVPTRTETACMVELNRSGTVLPMPGYMQVDTNGEITELYSAENGVSGDAISFLFIYLINNTNNPYNA